MASSERPITRTDCLSFETVRAEFEVPSEYPAAAVAEAERASDRFASDRRDLREVAFVTLDPPTSMDLDQAFLLERTDAGFELHYAIADVAALITPGGALDAESHRRGQTLYLPDGKAPLHPQVFSEGLASLLPNEDRAAIVWHLSFDREAQLTGYRLERALVRSVAKLDYPGVQRSFDADEGIHPSLAPLQEFGRLRRARAVERGAVELELPEQSVTRDGDRYRLEIEPRTEADGWNAELSLATGMVAADLMLRHDLGMLRTLPEPAAETLKALRTAVTALGFEWPEGATAGAVLGGLPRDDPRTLAAMSSATKLLRGAAYTLLPETPPEDAKPAGAPHDGERAASPRSHAGIAAPYAHVTAPLRRLADRYVAEVCLALCEGREVPAFALEALPAMPKTMGASDQLAGRIERACVDLAEAEVLQPLVGHAFAAIVLRPLGADEAEIFIEEPAVLAPCATTAQPGSRVTARLEAVDAAKREVRFSA